MNTSGEDGAMFLAPRHLASRLTEDPGVPQKNACTPLFHQLSRYGSTGKLDAALAREGCSLGQLVAGTTPGLYVMFTSRRTLISKGSNLDHLQI